MMIVVAIIEEQKMEDAIQGFGQTTRLKSTTQWRS